METELEFPYRKIEFNNENQLIGNSNIMTINDYVKKKTHRVKARARLYLKNNPRVKSFIEL